MTDLSRRASRSILQAYDFGHFTTVVDVGGGKDGLLTAVLRKYSGGRAGGCDLADVSACDADNAKLLIIERTVDGAGGAQQDIAFSDMEMLVGNGGQERTIGEFEALLSAGGLRLEQLTPTDSDMSVLRALRA